MPISGLVITLASAADAAVPELDRLEADPRLELGARAGARIAAVAETDSPGPPVFLSAAPLPTSLRRSRRASSTSTSRSPAPT